MNKKKKPDAEKGISIALTIGVVIAVALVGGAILNSGLNSMHKEAMDQARDDINNMQNVSDDYKQGWNDCLAKINDHYSKACNTTAAIAEV